MAESHAEPAAEADADAANRASDRHDRIAEGDEEVSATLEQAIDAGAQRIERGWLQLVATGLVGGVDVAFGVLALLVVTDETGSKALGAVAFGLGFVALTLANSELFTENFLLPVSAVVARRAPMRSLGRLWSVTAAANLAGGYVLTALFASSIPEVEAPAVELASRYPELGIGWDSFSLSVLGGAVITLMTWMERGASGELARIVAAVAAAFLLVEAGLEHSIVASFEMFTALWVGAPFGYLDWLAVLGWSAFGNIVGGVGLVTVLRIVQAGPEKIRFERRVSSER